MKGKTQGGKGNEGMFIERDPNGIVAAGLTSAQPNLNVAEHLKHYFLQEEVDALIHDAFIPEPKKQTSGFIGKSSINAGELINPPTKSKFQNLVNEMKETIYDSYWKKPIGKTRDQAPILPAGLDIHNVTFGRKTTFSETASSVINPKDTPIATTPRSLEPGYQLDRKYCRPPYEPNQIFGITYKADRTGVYARCCLSEDKLKLGTAFYSPRHSMEAGIKAERGGQLGQPATPNDNIKRVPIGHAFGKLEPSAANVPNSLTTCGINFGREFFLECLGYLNTLRKCLSKLHNGEFFQQFYLRMKYLDKVNTGWLPKDVVYNFCSAKNVRVNPTLIEPLLEMWNGFDGTQIQYKMFVDTINFRKPSPSIPKIPDMAIECVEFSTTYNDMVTPGQKVDKRHMAGLPSGRYFDKDEPITPAGLCKADRINLPDESDVRSCVSPSSFTRYGVTHRDMYARRSPDVVRRVFKATGENFNDKKFNELWEKAKKYHSEGWVSFATFRKVIDQ